jgi:hypothetical protein
LRPTDLIRRAVRLPREVDALKTSLARIHIAALASGSPLDDPRHAEFKAFSQFGEDGILQYLLAHTEFVPKRFVEFGVEDYREATTRLLAELGGWDGFVMDGSERNIRRLRNDPIMWRSKLSAQQQFVTRENIAATLEQAGFDVDIGVLVIDIDGNDFWIWQAITECRPAIVVVEYNALWGIEHPVSIPYQSDFERFSAHPSGLYAGASLPALMHLAKEKGYRLVAVNSQSNNAFFLRDDSGSALRTVAIANWMGIPGFQQARTASGRLSYEGDERALTALSTLSLVDVTTSERITVGELIDIRSAPRG